MVFRNKEDPKSIKEWLLSIEKSIGQPVVVSLLIRRGQITFLSCMEQRNSLMKSLYEDFPLTYPKIAEMMGRYSTKNITVSEISRIVGGG